MAKDRGPFVSRGGLKLDHALRHFGLDVAGRTCADFGCSTGGFTDVLIQRGAAQVYSVDTGYGVLDWTLRNDPRVVVLERTNAMHVELPERVGFLSVDASWTRQRNLLPNVARNLADGGDVVTLVKPHYEAAKDRLVKGVLPDERRPEVLAAVLADVEAAGFVLLGETDSPILGGSGKNVEVLWWLRRSPETVGG